MSFEIEVKKNAFSSATFYIDNQILRFDGKEIPISHISGFGYMSTQVRVNGINAGKTFEIKIWQNDDITPVTFRFMGVFGGGSANEKYYTVTDQLWKYFGDQMLNKLHQNLLDGKTIELAPKLKLTSKGIVVRRKPLFKPAYEVLGAWDELNANPYQGMVTIKSTVNRKAKTTERLIDKNRWLLYYYIQWLLSVPDVAVRLMTVPNNYQLIEKRK